MFHLQLTEFPHKTSDYNMSEQALRAIVDPWVREQYVEVGERKWSPHNAEITILEGPELALGQLSMGRGWSNALHVSEDVTRRVLAAAGQAATSSAAAAGSSASASADDLLSLLGDGAAELLVVWRAVAASAAGLTPSESLARAERAIAAPEPDAS